MTVCGSNGQLNIDISTSTSTSTNIMDPTFYEKCFQPLFIKMAVLNIKQQKQETNEPRFELTAEEQQLYSVLKYALPAIQRLQDNPNLTVCQAVSDNPTSQKGLPAASDAGDGVTQEIIIPSVILQQPPSPPQFKEPDHSLTHWEEPSDEETIAVLQRLDLEAEALMEQIQKDKWISVFPDTETDVDSNMSDQDGDSVSTPSVTLNRVPTVSNLPNNLRSIEIEAAEDKDSGDEGDVDNEDNEDNDTSEDDRILSSLIDRIVPVNQLCVSGT